MKRTMFWSALALAALPAPSLANDLVTADPAVIAKVLTDSGYRAKIDKDSSGDPMIESGVSGYTFYIYFYGCQQARDCTTVQLEAAFDPGSRVITLQDVNDYNNARRFGAGVIAKNGDPTIRLDIDLEDGGMSKELFLDHIEFWEISVARFADMVFSKEVNTGKTPTK